MPPSIISLLSHPKGMLKEEFQRYKSVFKNYLPVTYHAARGIYPVKGVIRSTGNVVTFNRYDQMCLFVHGIMDVSYDVGTGRLTFTSKYGRKIVFIREEGENDEINGSICGEFGDEIYDFCDVNGRYVVDVGANIGASAIYFATKGAKKVLAFEPFPYSCKMMERNVKENNLSDVITAFNKGVGKEGFVTIDPQFVSGTQSQLKDQEKGVPIEVVSLNRIVRENMKDEYNAVLKMNCEGCKYDTIMGTDDETLKHFSELRIDYHFGIRDLVSRLSSLEYNVRYSEPIRAHDRSSTVPDMELGWIQANKSIPAT